MYIVFLNLADTQRVLSNKSVAALRKKYPAYGGWNPVYYYWNNNAVDEIDVIQLYHQWKRGQRDLLYIQGMNRVRLCCGKADKIMFGVHGNVGDTDSASIEDFGTAGGKVTCQDLAAFFLECLPGTQGGWWVVPGLGGSPRQLHVSLIMCFGARAQAHLADHTGNLSEAAIKSSFAYKFYKLICVRRPILMTARTGSVSFDENTGRSLVQTEDAVKAEAEYNELQAAVMTQRINDMHDNLWERASPDQRKELRRRKDLIDAEIQRGRTDWSMASSEELVLIRFALLKQKIQALTNAKDVSIAKHGKFVFSYDSGTQQVTVLRKYPTPRVIYQGAL